MLSKNSRHCACCRSNQQCHQYRRQYQNQFQSSDQYQYTKVRCCARLVPVDKTEVLFGLALVLSTVILLVESLPYQEWDPSIKDNTKKYITDDTSSPKQTIHNAEVSRGTGGLPPQASRDSQTKTNEDARNVLELILKQYYSRVFASMMVRKSPTLVESQVVSKRQQEISSVPERSMIAPHLSNTKLDTTPTLDDHYSLIESYAKSPLDFFTNRTISAESTIGANLDSNSADNHHAMVGGSTNQYSLNNRENDNYVEALLNEIVIEQMLNRQERSRNIRLGKGVAISNEQHQIGDGEHEYVDVDSSTSDSFDDTSGNSENNDQTNYEQQDNIDDSSQNTDMNIGNLNYQKNDGLSNFLLRRQQHHQSTMAPVFIASLTSPLSIDDNYSKRQIRFYPCYFNPISCFTKR